MSQLSTYFILEIKKNKKNFLGTANLEVKMWKCNRKVLLSEMFKVAETQLCI